MKRVPPSLLALSIAAILIAGVAVPRADDASPPPSRAGGELADGAGVAAILDASSPHAGPTAAPIAIGEPRLDRVSGRFVAPLGAGRAILTLDPRLQSRLERSLDGYRVPWGATVLLEPATGRVLALAEH